MRRGLPVLKSVLLLVAVWQFVVWLELVPETYFPGPVKTALALWGGLTGGELSRAAGQTMLRAVMGILGASALGIGIALLTARYQVVQRAFDPVAEFLRPLPPAALVPLSIFLLGLGWTLHAFILLFACLWPVYLSASSALKAVPTVQLRTSSVYGYEGWAKVWNVQFPAALPEIFIGIRVAAGVALMAAVVTEMLAGRDGLGFVISDSALTMRIPDVFAALVLTMLCGFTMNSLVVWARYHFVRWHLDLTSSNRQ